MWEIESVSLPIPKSGAVGGGSGKEEEKRHCRDKLGGAEEETAMLWVALVVVECAFVL